MNITLEQVLEKSNLKLVNGPDAGKKVLEHNLEKMKNWKKSRVQFFFDEKRTGKLIPKPKNEAQDDHKIITTSRRYVRKSLKKIFEEAKIRTPLGGFGKLAAELISKKNILEKFKNAEVELNALNV